MQFGSNSDISLEFVSSVFPAKFNLLMFYCFNECHLVQLANRSEKVLFGLFEKCCVAQHVSAGGA